MRTALSLVLSLVLLIFIASCAACEDEYLTKTCPISVDQPCAVRDDGQLIAGNVIARGECILGKTACTDDNEEIYCDGYVGPSEEICDSLDNDCDGYIDDGFDKDKDNFTTCGGDCDDRDHRINPSIVESCNNVDDNCNGEIDEAVTKECWTTNNGVVFGGNSICRKGIQECNKGKWTFCGGEIKSRREVCNGVDDNCNGEVDETIYGGCGPFNEMGQCRRGNQVCVDNETFCVEAAYESAEVCDGIDNDCDGVSDEGLSKLCQTACGQGQETCENGIWINCSAPLPVEEVCGDGIDNDCDGEADEDCGCTQDDIQQCRGKALIDPADGSIIMCGFGYQICDQNEWGNCMFVGTSIEQCNNWDDDCDGTVDEITKTCGNPNMAGIGICQLGTSTCSAGLWNVCQGAVAPIDERCDGIDQDCNGLIDDGLTPHPKADICFGIDWSGSMCGVINVLAAGMANWGEPFIGSEHRFCLLKFPGTPPNGPTRRAYDVIVPLVDADVFITELNGMSCLGGGNEPSYDVMFTLSSPGDPAMVGWRSDAYPYIIIATDEPSQTWTGMTETNVATNCINCNIGICSAGDRIESYVITQGAFAAQWNEPTYFEANRIIEIYPAEIDRYEDELAKVLRNVCPTAN